MGSNPQPPQQPEPIYIWQIGGSWAWENRGETQGLITYLFKHATALPEDSNKEIYIENTSEDNNPKNEAYTTITLETIGEELTRYIQIQILQTLAIQFIDFLKHQKEKKLALLSHQPNHVYIHSTIKNTKEKWTGNKGKQIYETISDRELAWHLLNLTISGWRDLRRTTYIKRKRELDTKYQKLTLQASSWWRTYFHKVKICLYLLDEFTQLIQNSKFPLKIINSQKSL